MYTHTPCRIPNHDQHSQVVTFDLESAFLSNSNDLQSYLQQLSERGDSGCTPPGKNNPMCAAPPNVLLPHQLSKGDDYKVVMQRPPNHCQVLLGGDEYMTVYRKAELLQHSIAYKEEGFLSREQLALYGIPHMTALFCCKVFLLLACAWYSSATSHNYNSY